MRARYKHVSLPEELILRIDEKIKEGDLAFRSRAEVVIYCLRRFLDIKKI